MGLTWDGRRLIQSGKSCQKPAWKTKKLACFSPLALAGRTKLTAKPFQMGGEGREGEGGKRRGNHFKGKGGEGRGREGREE